MSEEQRGLQDKVALVTGGAHRIGAQVVRTLHGRGMRVALHYRSSREAAETLANELNARRPETVALFPADLLAVDRLAHLVERVLAAWGRLDVLVNNASSFAATPMGSVTLEQWEDLVGTNLRAPFFLTQAAAPHLRACRGCVVNLADVHGLRPYKDHPVYSTAKAGLVMLTQALARELGPEVRVNAVAPGAILWPEAGTDEVRQQRIVSQTALKRQGTPAEVARAVLFLAEDADYVTGQVLAVDGGRSLASV